MSTFFHTLLFSLPFVWIGCLLRLTFTAPKSTYRICLGIAIVGGLLGGVFGKGFGLGAYGGFFPPLIGICAVRLFESIRKSWLQHLAATAIDLREYAVRMFNALDGDGDGVITRVDIEDFREHYYDSLVAGMAQGTQSPDVRLFCILDKNLSVVGHVIDSKIAVLPSMMGGAHAVETYGISRQDLETWPARVSSMLVDEFGIQNASIVSQ